MSGDLQVIYHMSSSGSTCSSYVNASVQEELPSVPSLCPPAQRWQMWPPQWKYWELPGHLSGNIWAIWTITFCKWTQIKMYVVAFARASASFCGSYHSYPSYYCGIIYAPCFGGSARCEVYLLHGAQRSTVVTFPNVAHEHLNAAGHAGCVISGQLNERKMKVDLLKESLVKVFTWHMLTHSTFCSVNKLQTGEQLNAISPNLFPNSLSVCCVLGENCYLLLPTLNLFHIKKPVYQKARPQDLSCEILFAFVNISVCKNCPTLALCAKNKTKQRLKTLSCNACHFS